MGDMACPGLESNETLGNYQKRVLGLFNTKQINFGDPDGSDEIHTLREAITREANNIEILNTNLAKLNDLYNFFIRNNNFPMSPRGQEKFISEYNNKLGELNAIFEVELNIQALVSGADNNADIVQGNLGQINTIISELQENYGKERDALNVQQSQNNEALKAKENDLREFIKQCALAEKERNRDPDKLSPAAANNNRLLIAALPYVALNKIWAPCPELFDQYLSGKEKIKEGDLTPDSYKTLCGLLMNICLAYVVKYTKKSKQEAQVPGYAELFKPHADTIMKALPVISDVDIAESFSNFNKRGQYLGEVLANKTSDVERAVLASTLYSLPTMVYTVQPGEAVLPSRQAIEFNNATVKPRFLQQSLRQDEMYVNYCDSAARLLDMGGDGCRTAPSKFPQSYQFEINGRNMANRTNLVFFPDGENYSINMAFGESQRDIGGRVYGDFKDYGFRYEIIDTKSVTEIGNMFSKRGAAQQMAEAFITGLNSIQTKANLNNVTTRYNLFLRNPTWINPLLTGAAHKMFGDLCRDTLELFTKFTINRVPQTGDSILANNDRPAQAMATYMAAALTVANNSGSCWATDTSGKTDDQVMAVWGVRGEPSWTKSEKLDQTSIVDGIDGLARGVPPNNAYKDVVPILMAALDGIHDFVPSSTFMEKLASSFSEAKSGGGKVKKQKGGAPDYDPRNPSVFEKDRLLDELNEYAEVNSIMIAIDQALAVEQGFMELNKIYVSGRATSFYGYNHEVTDTLFIVGLDSPQYISQERLFINNFKAIAARHSISVEGETIIVPFPDKFSYDTIQMPAKDFQDLLSEHMNENADFPINELLPQIKFEECFALYRDTHYRISETLKVTEIDEDVLLQRLGIEVTVPERVVKGMGQPTGDPFVDRTMEEAAAARADEEWMKQHAVLVEAARESLKTPAFKSYTDSQRKRLHYSDDDDEDDNIRRTVSVPKIARYDAGYEPIRTQSAPDPHFPLTPPESQEEYGAADPAAAQAALPQHIIKHLMRAGFYGDTSSGQGRRVQPGGGKRRTMKNKSKSKRNAKNQTHRKRKGKAVGKRTGTTHRPKIARNAKKIIKKRTSNIKTRRSTRRS